MDQHAFLQFDPLFPMKVGDIVGFDIAHPCLTFDKWRFVPVIDHMWNVVDVVQTFF
jgi:D-serine dehydratase